VNITCTNIACLTDMLSMIPPLNLDLCTHKTLFGVCNGYLECLLWLCTQFLIIPDRKLILQHVSKYFVIWLHFKLYTKFNALHLFTVTHRQVSCAIKVSINNSGFNHQSAILDTCLSKHSKELNPRCLHSELQPFAVWIEHNGQQSSAS